MPLAATRTTRQATITVTRGVVTVKWIGVALFGVLLMPAVSLAWDGYDWDGGVDVEIGKGNLVRPGSSIEIYDYGTGQYHDVEVQSVTGGGSTVEVEVYDNTTGEYRILEMED